MTTQITLTGRTDYNHRSPPRDAKKGYVARITGHTGGRTYAREFLGSEVDLREGDEGLYELQHGGEKGGFTRWHHVLLKHPKHGLILSTDCGNELPKIAKLLDAGADIHDAIEIVDLRPSELHKGRMIFTARARTARPAKLWTERFEAKTIETATAACWETLVGLSGKDQEAVLAELRKRVSPSKS